MSDTADDGELWQRARAGEPECFGMLFDRHGEAVRTFCARRTGSLDAADDLVSIVFLEAWRRIVQLYGLSGTDVTGVDLRLANGLRISATLRAGIWGLWWPSDRGSAADSRLEIHTATGTKTVDPDAVRLPL